jgi:hypothetical protein
MLYRLEHLQRRRKNQPPRQKEIKGSGLFLYGIPLSA